MAQPIYCQPQIHLPCFSYSMYMNEQTKRWYDVNMLKDYKVALAYVFCIKKTMKSSSQNDSLNARCEAIK